MAEIMPHLFEQMSLKVAKETIKEWLDEIHMIENQLSTKLVFDGNKLEAERLIDEIKALGKRFKVTSSGGEPLNASRCNHEENSTLVFIQDKETMLIRVEVFVELFNELDQDDRVIIYGSFFKNHFNVLMARKLNVSLSTLERMKSKVIINFAEMLVFEQFLHQLDD